MFITHDMAVVAQMADRVVVMNPGKKVEEGTVHEIFNNPQHEYTKSLLAAVPKLGEMASKKYPEPMRLGGEKKRKVLKAIVDTQPNKIETLNEEIKTTVISQAIDAAKNQQEGTSSDDEDLSNTVAEIVTKADNDTATKVLETLDEATSETDSKLALTVVNNLTKQENYEEKIEILKI